MSGHCRKCFAVVWRDGHKAGCELGAVGRKPPRCCVQGERQPEAWVLLDDRTAAFLEFQKQGDA